MYHNIQEAAKEPNKKAEIDETTEVATPDEKKNDKVASEKKQSNVENDGDVIEPEDSTKKKKKKSGKEEIKEKGNSIYLLIHCLIDFFL